MEISDSLNDTSRMCFRHEWFLRVEIRDCINRRVRVIEGHHVAESWDWKASGPTRVRIRSTPGCAGRRSVKERSHDSRPSTLGAVRSYDLHRRWMTEILPNGGSLLVDGARIWTTETLTELSAKFIDQPDLTKNKSFLEKLRDQLSTASPEAIQLMAELHIVHFQIIWTGAISQAKKISDVQAILSWMHPPRPGAS